MATEGEKSHFRRRHSHLTPPRQRTQTTIGISLIHCQKPQTVVYIFAAVRISASLSILKQSCRKTRTSTQNNSTRKKQYLTQNGCSRSFKVICFNVDKKPLGTTYSDIIILVSYIQNCKRYSNCNKQNWQFSTTPRMSA